MIYVDIYSEKNGWCQFGSFRTDSIFNVTQKAFKYSKHFQIPYKDLRLRCEDGRIFDVAELVVILRRGELLEKENKRSSLV